MFEEVGAVGFKAGSMMSRSEPQPRLVNPRLREKLLGQVGQLTQERVGGGEPQSDTGADDERSVDQTGQQEHLGLQLAHEFGLTGSRLEVLAAHDADADTGTDGDRKSTRLNSSHTDISRMPSSA